MPAENWEQNAHFANKIQLHSLPKTQKFLLSLSNILYLHHSLQMKLRHWSMEV